MQAKQPYQYWHSVQLLRGMAALAVCLFHFSAFWSEGLWAREIAQYGKYGVHAFFVISGFILPYTLWHRNHTIKAYPKFIFKRLIRLEPPYIISIIAIVGLRWAAATFSPYSSQVFSLDIVNILWHLGYLVPFVEDQMWLNPVFWTLAIEFQFYLFIGLLFHLFIIKNEWLRFGVFTLWIITFFLPFGDIWLFYYNPLFGIGLAFFLFHEKLFNTVFFSISILVCFGLQFYYDPAAAIAALIALAFIIWGSSGGKVGQWLGNISYSLYLLHIPIGASLVLDFGQNFVQGDIANTFLIILAIIISCFSAWLMYLIIERPSQRLAKRI